MFLPLWEDRNIRIFLRMSKIYDLANPGRFAFTDRIFRDAGTEHFKAHKSGTVPEKPGEEWDPDV
jgi:hypothetical protein